ncbi:MAG: cob(I)yrinic acid a,c-diamide adenosyltransferase [Acidobacteria bacterium]|nr:cob(I)yrinic acid a,c-diamide adenosyltransferase [Acidobacteriota bacterium]
MSEITTKTGDGGFSSLYSGERVLKSDVVFEALGTLDELNSWLGFVKVKFPENSFEHVQVETIQKNIFRIASNVATAKDSPMRKHFEMLAENDLIELETFEERLFQSVTMPKTFIIPGVTEDSAGLDIARTVCRRAERRMVRLLSDGTDRLALDVKYVNRLSDVLYILARQLDEGRFKERQ